MLHSPLLRSNWMSAEQQGTHAPNCRNRWTPCAHPLRSLVTPSAPVTRSSCFQLELRLTRAGRLGTRMASATLTHLLHLHRRQANSLPHIPTAITLTIRMPFPLQSIPRQQQQHTHSEQPKHLDEGPKLHGPQCSHPDLRQDMTETKQPAIERTTKTVGAHLSHNSKLSRT